MINCFLPSAEETQIRFNFPGQEPVVVDAVDVANMIDQIRADLPEDSSVEAEIVTQFQKKFNRKISKTAAAYVWDVVHRVMQDVKKKLYQEPAPLEDTATAVSQTETSSSSIG